MDDVEVTVTIRTRPLVGELKHTSIVQCACGGYIRADRRFPATGVANHRRTKLHRAWREGNGL